MKKLLFLLVLVVAGCKQDQLIVPNSVSLNRQFSLHVNQEAAVEGTNLAITFKGVASDSRCPDNARCIWAGNAELIFELRDSGQPPKPATLNTFLEPKLIQYSWYQIQLTDLTPYPHAPDQINPAEYVATIVVSGN
jgi:hypothetical protein